MSPDVKSRADLVKALGRFTPDELSDLSDILIENYAREGLWAFLNGGYVKHSFGRMVEARATMVWIFCGNNQTGSDGDTVIKLNDYLCAISGMSADEAWHFGTISARPSFVATPNSESPVLLTTSCSVKEVPEPVPGVGAAAPVLPCSDRAPLEVQVTVMSWKLDGTPAPLTSFDWTCIVEGARWFIPAG